MAPDSRGYALAESTKLIKEHNGRFVYRSGGIRRIPNELAPPTTTSFNLKADLVIPPQGAQGVIVAQGGSVGGYTLYVKDNRPAYCYNFFGAESHCIHSAEALPAGKVSLRFGFRKTPKAQQATGALYVNDRKVGDVTIGRTSPMWLQTGEVFNVGLDEGSRGSDEYGADNAFSGAIEQVVFDVAPPAPTVPAPAAPQAAMH